MKLGLLTAAFPDLSLEEVAGWASASGFQALEIACWPAASAERRRYAGVSHIDVERLDAPGARAVRELLDRHGLAISALAYYPNPLDPDAEVRAAAQAHLRRVIAAAETLGVDVVCTFVGRDQRRSVPESLEDVRAAWPPGRWAAARPASFSSEGSRSSSSLGRSRWPIHSSSGRSDSQQAAAAAPSISKRSAFLRPGLTCETVSAPRAPPS